LVGYSENRANAHRTGSTNGRSERSPLLEMPRSSSVGQSTDRRLLFCRSTGESDSSRSHKLGSAADGTKKEYDSDSPSDSQFTVCVQENKSLS